jgi:hypothetical protein
MLINDSVSEMTAGTMKKVTVEVGQYVAPKWLQIAPSNGPKMKPSENAAPIHAFERHAETKTKYNINQSLWTIMIINQSQRSHLMFCQDRRKE